MHRGVVPLALAILSAISACGSRTNDEYCDETTPCGDPARPFCDMEGQYPASGGIAHTCIADPSQQQAPDGGAPVGPTPDADPSVLALIVQTPVFPPGATHVRVRTTADAILLSGLAYGTGVEVHVNANVVSVDESGAWEYSYDLSAIGCLDAPAAVTIYASDAGGSTTEPYTIEAVKDDCPPTITVIGGQVEDERGYLVRVNNTTLVPCLVKNAASSPISSTTLAEGTTPPLYKYATNTSAAAPSALIPAHCDGASFSGGDQIVTANPISFTVEVGDNVEYRSDEPWEVTFRVKSPNAVVSATHSATLVTAVPEGQTTITYRVSVTGEPENFPDLRTLNGVYEVTVYANDGGGVPSGDTPVIKWNYHVLGGPIVTGPPLARTSPNSPYPYIGSSVWGFGASQTFATLATNVGGVNVGWYTLYNKTALPVYVAFNAPQYQSFYSRTIHNRNRFVQHVATDYQGQCTYFSLASGACLASPPAEADTSSGLHSTSVGPLGVVVTGRDQSASVPKCASCPSDEWLVAAGTSVDVLGQVAALGYLAGPGYSDFTASSRVLYGTQGSRYGRVRGVRYCPGCTSCSQCPLGDPTPDPCCADNYVQAEYDVCEPVEYDYDADIRFEYPMALQISGLRAVAGSESIGTGIGGAYTSVTLVQDPAAWVEGSPFATGDSRCN